MYNNYKKAKITFFNNILLYVYDTNRYIDIHTCVSTCGIIKIVVK